MTRLFHIVTLLSCFVVNAIAEKSHLTNFPVVIQEFKDTVYNFYNVLDMDSGNWIEHVYVPIMIPRGKQQAIPDSVKLIIEKKFRSGENVDVQYKPVAPPLIGTWGMFDNQGNAVCALWLYTVDTFVFSGLRTIDTDKNIFQSSSNEFWKGSFDSSELRDFLLESPDLFLDNNNTNSIRWQKLRPLLPSYRDISNQPPINIPSSFTNSKGGG